MNYSLMFCAQSAAEIGFYSNSVPAYSERIME